MVSEGENKASYKYLKESLKQERSKIERGVTKTSIQIAFLMEIDVVTVGEFDIFRASLLKQDFEHMEALFTLDGEGTITDSNQFVLPLFGYRKEELVALHSVLWLLTSRLREMETLPKDKRLPPLNGQL